MLIPLLPPPPLLLFFLFFPFFPLLLSLLSSTSPSGALMQKLPYPEGKGMVVEGSEAVMAEVGNGGWIDG